MPCRTSGGRSQRGAALGRAGVHGASQGASALSKSARRRWTGGRSCISGDRVIPARGRGNMEAMTDPVATALELHAHALRELARALVGAGDADDVMQATAASA